ncbi:MAG: type III pantothenate kinase [Cocleimonas sp.]|nr:type III pantothenate kinase [Cocleimonas sp.]
MILLVDAGNSRLKWATITANQRSKQLAQDYHSQSALEGLKHCLQNVFIDTEETQRQLILVAVLGDAFQQATHTLCQQLKISLHYVTAQTIAYGVHNGYTIAAHLGADRFVGLVAAHHLIANEHRIIISCGTAITIDALSVNGYHLGGLILPGLHSFSDSLIKKTAQLNTAKTANTTLFANNTADAIQSGCVYGLVEAITGISSRMRKELLKINHLEEYPKRKVSVRTILCGGDAKLVHRYLLGTTQREDDWIMQGLQIIATTINPSQA